MIEFLGQQILLHQARPAEDGVQRGAQFVRNHPEKFILLPDLLAHLIARSAERFFGQFLLVDIGAGAEPVRDLALGISVRQGATEKPAVRAVDRTLQAKLDLVRVAGAERFPPGLVGAREIVGVKKMIPTLLRRARFI